MPMPSGPGASPWLVRLPHTSSGSSCFVALNDSVSLASACSRSSSSFAIDARRDTCDARLDRPLEEDLRRADGDEGAADERRLDVGERGGERAADERRLDVGERGGDDAGGTDVIGSTTSTAELPPQQGICSAFSLILEVCL